MAMTQSNIVSPQQAALNAKKQKLPLSVWNPVVTPKSAPVATPAPAPVAQAPAPAPKPVAAPVAQKPVLPAANPQPPKPATYEWQTPEQKANTMNGAPTREDHTSRFTGLLGNLIKYATGQNEQSPLVKASLDQYSKISGQIQDVRSKTAEGRGALLTSGMTSPVAQGRAAVVAQTGAAQESALATQQANELAKANLGITERNTAITGLTSGMSAVKPELNTYGLAYYDPSTGQMTEAGNQAALNPIANIQSIAQQVVNGQISPSQGYALGGNVANFQGALNQAIQQLSPGFDTGVAQGRFDAKQSNVTTAGTAPTNAFASTYQQNYPQYIALKQSLSNVEQLGALAVKVGTKGGVNPLDPQYANLAINQFRNQLSDADQVKFNSAIVAFAGAASQLLTDSSGQTPTEVTNSIQGIVSGNVKMSTLAALVAQATVEGEIKLANAAAAVNTPGSNIGAPSVAAPQVNNQAPTVSIDALRAKYEY